MMHYPAGSSYQKIHCSHKGMDMVSNNTFTFSNLADAFIRLTKRLTIGEYMKRFILKRQNKYKLAREGINKEKLFCFFWEGGIYDEVR